jgi:hypothetical protein
MSDHPGNNLVQRGRCQECDCPFSLFRDPPLLQKVPLHTEQICICGHPYLVHQGNRELPPEGAAPPTSMQMDTEAAAVAPTTSIQMDTEAVAAAVAWNPPLMAFNASPACASQSSSCLRMWKDLPSASGTVQTLRMGSATRNRPPQSARCPTTEPLLNRGAANGNIEFKLIIWPFVVSTFNVVYNHLLPWLAYQKKHYSLIPCTCVRLFTARFCRSHPDTRTK